MMDRKFGIDRWIEDVTEFHGKFGPVYDGPMRALPSDFGVFRARRLIEEVQEYLLAPTLAEKLDGLVDTVYIAVGCMYLHGLKNAGMADVGIGACEHKPRPLYGMAAASVRDHMARYAYVYLTSCSDELGFHDVARSLHGMVETCMQAATGHGFTKFGVAWDRIHAANMRKERVARAELSRFGSAWDIVKPEGWQAPVL